MFESLSAISEGGESSAKNPSREPTFSSLETLEALNSFESAVQLFVAAFNDVRSFGAATMKELFRLHISCQ